MVATHYCSTDCSGWLRDRRLILDYLQPKNVHVRDYLGAAGGLWRNYRVKILRGPPKRSKDSTTHGTCHLPRPTIIFSGLLFGRISFSVQQTYRYYMRCPRSHDTHIFRRYRLLQIRVRPRQPEYV